MRLRTIFPPKQPPMFTLTAEARMGRSLGFLRHVPCPTHRFLRLQPLRLLSIDAGWAQAPQAEPPAPLASNSFTPKPSLGSHTEKEKRAKPRALLPPAPCRCNSAGRRGRDLSEPPGGQPASSLPVPLPSLSGMLRAPAPPQHHPSRSGGGRCRGGPGAASSAGAGGSGSPLGPGAGSVRTRIAAHTRARCADTRGEPTGAAPPAPLSRSAPAPTQRSRLSHGARTRSPLPRALTRTRPTDTLLRAPRRHAHGRGHAAGATATEHTRQPPPRDTPGRTDTAPLPTRNFSHAALSPPLPTPTATPDVGGGHTHAPTPRHTNTHPDGEKNTPTLRPPPAQPRTHAGARLRVAQQVAAPAPASPGNTGSGARSAQPRSPSVPPPCPSLSHGPGAAPRLRVGAPGPAAALTWMRPVPGALIQRRLHRLLLPAGTGLPPPPRLLRFVIHG